MNRSPKKIKNWRSKSPPIGFKIMVRPIGVEPTHLAPEASALSTELRAHEKLILLRP